jgi:hypothetical protein
MSSEDKKDIVNDDTLDNVDEQQAALEELVAQTLLVELFNAKKAEVFENVVFEGKRRYYIEDLTERDYSLENTTPYQLDILGHAIEEHSWGNLLCKTAELLLKLFPEYQVKKILDFQCQWSKAKMFSLEQRTNFKPIAGGLYVNCNHTALHACWFLQDLLDFFGIDKSSVSFLIHRPSSAEPQKVKDYVEKRFKRNFAVFIKMRYDKSDEYTEKVISRIEKYLNPMLVKISKSYTNFFLFDDLSILANYTKKVRELINGNYKYDEKTKKILNKYLDYLVKFYKEK